MTKPPQNLLFVPYVYLAEFPFQEDPSITKKRPTAIIIKDSNNLFFSVKITSKGPDPHKNDVVLKDWSSAGLDKPCCARCSHVVMFKPPMMEILHCYGELSERDHHSILAEIEKMKANGQFVIQSIPEEPGA